MRARGPFKTYGVFVVLSVMILSACHGSGGGSTVVAPPIPTVLTVGAPPVSDTVVRPGFNAYAASVTPGSFYKISITAPTDDVDLNVYDADSTFTHPIICPVDNSVIPVTSPEDCILIPAGNTLYFGVDGSFLVGSAAVYTIGVELLSETKFASLHPASVIRPPSAAPEFIPCPYRPVPTPSASPGSPMTRISMSLSTTVPSFPQRSAPPPP